ncbi:AAA family ATPase [Aquibacillus rhizosphaerae]|uniref:Nuclease SbcCD subunit C n=1 Tax=Aquibacillus rhizosphaerae TaxID=3051431 RepID=A0ABT7L1M1_9BACI|nr:AAA family ATPase [Aquibacillus sp. LR5S19]MDL4839713.1 AAA family ATPase [Aquibacillus sp. LR5S19]
MRALILTMTAFGPYSNQQTIDFNDLGEESIFLITGPTGAGKTTIFDAICYALYGRASGSDRDQDSLRSHFATVDQPTEVTFVFKLKGRTYQVTRFPKQQKRKERGDGYTEDPARAELYELVEGNQKLIASKIKDVNETLEEMLGLDYEQFRKMIMIPQGEFRKLISENSKEREEILQKIFRTHFYERITDELKKQSKELREKIEQTEWKIEQETEKIQWSYNDAEETESTDELLIKLADEINKSKQENDQWNKALSKEKETLKLAQEKYYAGKQLAEKFEEYAKLEKNKTDLKNQQAEIDKQTETLKLAQKAAAIIPFENQTNERKQEWVEQHEKEVKQQAIVEKLTEKYNVVQQHYEAEANNEKEREKLKETIQSKEAQLEKLNHYVKVKSECNKVEQEKKAEKGNIEKIQREIEQLNSQLDRLEKQLNEENKWTIAYYQSEAKLKETTDKLNRLKRLQVETNKLTSMRSNYQKVNQQYQKKLKTIEEKRKQLLDLEEEQKKNHAYLLAQHLHDGAPCPVCGSKEHPNSAQENKSAISEESIKLLKKELQDEERDLPKWQDSYVQVKSDGQAQRSLVEDIHKEFKEQLPDLEEKAINEKIIEWDNLLNELKTERETIEKNVQLIEQAKKQRDKIQQDKKEKESKFQDQTKTLEKINESYIQLRTQQEAIEKELQEPETNPRTLQDELAQLQAKYKQWLKNWEDLQKQHEEMKQNLQQATTVLEQLQSFVMNTKQRYQDQLNVLDDKIAESNFSSLEAYKQAKCSTSEQERLQESIRDFEKRKSSVHERIADLAEQVKDQEQPDLVLLKDTVDKQEENIEKMNKSIHALSLQIDQHQHTKETIEALRKDQLNLAKQYYDIGELADLARGENHLKLSFERYVLSSFLDEILLQANIRLDQLTEHRYQLIRSDQVAKRGAQSGLDLEVLDHHTGQQRSVKTLSGGEGFKAALSLALGMADVVQAHAGGVQLETLFIDEGFGTLDELSLEQAIDCLKGLQQSNRVLGIISHVPQLKEEIHAKLQIIPSPQGSRATFSF